MRKLLAAGLILLAVLGLSRPASPAEQRSQFDHRTTGFELLGRHREVPCEACHVNAVFRGTPRDCVACHGAGTAVRAPGKPTSHILTTNRCEACHTPDSWVPAVNFDHMQTLGSCSSCHNNVQAPGKGAQHVATALECNACHDTLGWAGAKFDHAGITGGCASCHNGVQAIGMPPNHIPTAGAPCEDCHSTTEFTTFNGAVMDHAVVASIPCSTCHEAGKSFAGTPIVTTRPPAPHPGSGECSGCHTTASWNATDVPANHIPLPAADANKCSLCHSNESDFAVYTMNHVNIASNCAQCHGPGLAFANMAPPTLKEPPTNHIPTNGAACEDCHSPTQFTNFDGSTMDHAVVASTPCSSCHEAGKSFAGTPIVATRPPAPHPATGECSTCHTTANWNATDLPSNHIPLPAADANNCALCHGNQSDFSVYTMNHVNIASNCAQCHGPGLAFANMAPPTLKEPPTNHIPVGGAPCEDCHSPTQFTNFDGSTMDHAVVSSTPCSTCHEAGKSFAGTPVVTTRPPAPHPTTGECSNCHSTANWNATSLPANHIPLPAADAGNCALCHTNPSDYSVYVMNHVNIASNCAQCHGAGLSFANMAPPTLKEPPTGPPRHVPIGTLACELCHVADELRQLLRHDHAPCGGDRAGVRQLPRARHGLVRRAQSLGAAGSQPPRRPGLRQFGLPPPARQAAAAAVADPCGDCGRAADHDASDRVRYTHDPYARVSPDGRGRRHGGSGIEAGPRDGAGRAGEEPLRPHAARAIGADRGSQPARGSLRLLPQRDHRDRRAARASRRLGSLRLVATPPMPGCRRGSIIWRSLREPAPPAITVCARSGCPAITYGPSSPATRATARSAGLPSGSIIRDSSAAAPAATTTWPRSA